MLLGEETIIKFGYAPSELGRKSHRLVVCQCDYCTEPFERTMMRIKVGEKDSCRKCSSAKRKESNLIKYGCENTFSNKEVQAKIKKTNLEKYGVENPSSNKEIHEKKKKTLLANYGVDSPLKSEVVKDNAKATLKANYGVENAMFSAEVKEKHSNTNTEKYGSASPFGNKDIQAKIKLTNLDKYGVENPMQSPATVKKVQTTNLSRYGVTTNLQLPETVLSASQAIKVYRKTEAEIQTWLKSLGVEFKSNRTLLAGKEIDLYNDDLKLGIEYCGLYWHNELSPEPRLRNYHFDKYRKCKDQGVRLITIFEDEWLLRNAQVKGFLKSTLGMFKTKVFARKCRVKLIDKQISNDFIERYHIQGKTNQGLYAAGIYLGEELLGVISFGRHPRKKGEIVLDRLCFKEDHLIIGGASRLFKFLLTETGIKKISSWSDNRWSVGGIYAKLGFKLKQELPPDYSYTQIKSPTSRVSKQSQKKKNTDCPAGLTENQWSSANGLARIWDCGKLVWEYNN
jgi:hypothetical protein